LSLDLNTFF